MWIEEMTLPRNGGVGQNESMFAPLLSSAGEGKTSLLNLLCGTNLSSGQTASGSMEKIFLFR